MISFFTFYLNVPHETLKNHNVLHETILKKHSFIFSFTWNNGHDKYLNVARETGFC